MSVAVRWTQDVANGASTEASLAPPRVLITKARKLIQQKMSHEPIGFRLLPNLFTLTQLQTLYEAVYGTELDKRNFRKRVKDMDFIEKTELIDKKSSKRGAYLYRFNNKAYTEDSNFKL